MAAFAVCCLPFAVFAGFFLPFLPFCRLPFFWPKNRQKRQKLALGKMDFGHLKLHIFASVEVASAAPVGTAGTQFLLSVNRKYLQIYEQKICHFSRWRFSDRLYVI